MVDEIDGKEKKIWDNGGACLIGRNWIIELIDVDKREAAEQTANLQHLKYLQSHDVVSATPLQPLVVTVERYDDSRNHCSIAPQLPHDPQTGCGAGLLESFLAFSSPA